MKNTILIILSFFLFASASAEQHSNRIAIAPPIVTISDHRLQPITLTEVTIDSQIIANVATSTYELVFYNPNSRVLEGELVFSLFDGQNIIDYALQIKGKYRHASVVPKATAKEAYENTIRAQIDPSIIEKTIGNNFKTRLYPIPAKGYKRIKLTVQEVLDNVNNKFQYRIPLVTKHKLKKLKVLIDLPSLKSKPRSNFNGFVFDSATQGQSLKFEKENTQIKHPITINFDRSTQPNTFVQKSSSESYIFSSFDFNNEAANSQRKPPQNIAIIWNKSHSNKYRDIDKEMQFLNHYLQKAGTVRVHLAFLNNSVSQKNIGTICAHNVACNNGHTFSYLREQLKNARYEGTSDYSKLDFNTLKVDEVLMFSNGIKTIHAKGFANINKPITVINSSIKSDTDLLKRVAHQSNGRFIDLAKMSASEGVKKYLSNKTQIKVIGSSKNIDRKNVFTILQKDSINIFAKANNVEPGWVQLEIKHQNNKTLKAVKFEKPIYVKQNLNSLWASQKISNLSFDYKKNKDNIINLAKRYKVLTKDTSLIVLDRVEDYVRYEITPPHELRVQYSKLLKKKVNKKIYEKEQALIESIKLLQEQKVWYQKDFPKTKPVPVKESKKRAEYDEETALNTTVGAAMPAPVVMAAPAPVSAPRMEMARKAKKIASPAVTDKKGTIILKAFNPKAAYIKKIKAKDKSKWMETYYILKKSHTSQPMFYVDIADLFYKNQLKKEASTILSNLLELDFENSEFLRVFALKAMEFGDYQLAIKAFKKVKELRPFEPQSFRDLALAYERNKQPQKAANLLYHVLTHTWDGRFNGIKIVIINELNSILMKNKNLDKRKFDPRLINGMPVDLRIVINWSSDNTDIDLWVVDPYKEKTFYSNKISRIGGKISNDITQGYGPEEFMIKDAVAGNYIIQANYYGNSQQKTTIPVTIRAQIFSNFSMGNEVQKEIVLRLKNQKAVIDSGEYLYH